MSFGSKNTRSRLVFIACGALTCFFATRYFARASERLRKIRRLADRHKSIRLSPDSNVKLVSGSLTAGSAELSICSLNTLNRFWKKQWHNSFWIPDKVAEWSFRLALHYRLLREIDADIICLQEVPEGVTDFSAFATKHGYQLVMSTTILQVKTLTMFKSNKFRLVWETHRSRILVTQLELLPEVGAEESKLFVFVLNCHLTGFPKRLETRLSEVKSAMKHVNRQLKAHSKTLPGARYEIFMLGDMNAAATSSVYEAMTNGLKTSFVDPDNSDWRPKKDYSPGFVFREATAEFIERPLTYAHVPGHGRAIDLIFYTTNGSISLTHLRKPATEEQYQRAIEGGLPNEEFGSDHLPICAKFRLLPHR